MNFLSKGIESSVELRMLLHKTSSSYTFPHTPRIQKSSRKFFDFNYGFVSADGQVCTINDQAAILPYNYTGNAKDVA